MKKLLEFLRIIPSVLPGEKIEAGSIAYTIVPRSFLEAFGAGWEKPNNPIIYID